MHADPRDTILPAGSNEEIKMVLVPNFPSEEVKEVPGPLVIRHLVIHESTVPGAPPENLHSGTIKEIQELVTLLLIKERGVLEVGGVIRALDSANLPAEKSQILWVLQRSPKHRVFS